MKCYLCKGKGDIIQQKNRAICNRCFCKLFEKRIRKFARVNKIFRANERILVIGEVNKYLVESMIEKRPVKLFFKGNPDVDKVFLEWTADDEANDFLLNLFRDKKRKRFGKKEIKFLITVTNEEINRFAKLKGLKFKANEIDPDIKKLIDELQAKHPGVKYNLLKNIKELENVK